MRFIKFFIICSFSWLSGAELTISSYNCGGLPGHYDYLRQATMQKIMQERYSVDPETMSLNERIQAVALKKTFAKTNEERALAEQEWDLKNYTKTLERLNDKNGPNKEWGERVDQAITSYKVRPIRLLDFEVNACVNQYLNMLLQTIDADIGPLLQEKREAMARRIFTYYLKQDIICLQEANILDRSMFPAHYDVLFSEGSHSKNGVAWNKERFEYIKTLKTQVSRAFAVKLLDKESGQTILVASLHISGCNPYQVENDPKTGVPDSAKGDGEMRAILQILEREEADMTLLGMDSNVTSLHPRLGLLKEADYTLDHENYLDPTCSHPTQALNTRIDWIALKGSSAFITNIPILSVGLNSIETNISDHKPIGAKVVY